MIIVITYTDPKTNRQFISHGIDSDTLNNVVLPQDSVEHWVEKKVIYWDKTINEYVLAE